MHVPFFVPGSDILQYVIQRATQFRIKNVFWLIACKYNVVISHRLVKCYVVDINGYFDIDA